MNKTQVKVIISIDGQGTSEFEEVMKDCSYFFYTSFEHDAGIMDYTISSIDPIGLVTCDLVILHENDNLDDIILKMNYQFLVNKNHNYEIHKTTIVDWSIEKIAEADVIDSKTALDPMFIG